MGKWLSPWCKAVQIALIEHDMSVNDLAVAIGKTREYTSAIVNGRVYSTPTVKAICDYLNLPEETRSTTYSTADD